MDKIKFHLDGGLLALSALDESLGKTIEVSFTGDVRDRVDRSAAAVRRIVSSGQAAYGINTGFGHLCRKRIAPEQLETLQVNLIVSHAVGVGDPAPAQVVRWMMLFKIASLTHGVSGVSFSTLECLAQLLEHDVLPVIPTQGSLGASGDLAPLAHMVLPMIGRGTAVVNGQTMPGGEALAKFGIEPITLGPKEGLALINGTQFMSAYAVAIVLRARRLAKHTDISAAMSLEALMGSLDPFDEQLNSLRPHPGAIETADNMRRLMAESEILVSHADCDRVQDPYCLRCVPQVHGAARDALRHVGEVVECEINSVTDNPIIFDDDRVVSGGLFHGEPLALTLDYLAMALSELGSISERRVYLLLSGAQGLPLSLMRDTGLNSGFMLPQYTAAALVSENKGLCTPASVDSIPTSFGQEDHVSMGARAAVKGLQVLINTETVIAIEQMCAAQGLDFRAPLKAGIGPRVADAEIRKVITFADADRAFGEDIHTSLDLLRSQKILHAVEHAIGELR